jgi:RNA polymerase sigma-70 factor (ECF subfamily)
VNLADELKKAKQGDRQAIEKICVATWEPIYRLVYFKVQNREEAEDITQETYVKMLSGLKGNAAPRENLLGFLKTVALNILRDRWRQRKRRGVDIDVEAISPENMACDDHQQVVSLRLEIEDAMAKLTDDQRAVVDLRIINGHSVAETAEVLGKSEVAVRTCQHSALQSLAGLLDRDH